MLVVGRQILGVVLIANETIGSRMKCVKKGVICKSDFEKAFDDAN